MIANGFLNDVVFDDSWWKGGKFDMKSLERVHAMFRGRPYAMKYYLTYHNVMPTWGTPSKYGNKEESEALYRECLERGVTWEKATGYKEPPKDVVL